MMKNFAKKASFHGFEYQSRFQKKDGKKIARGLSRAREKILWKKEFAD